MGTFALAALLAAAPAGAEPSWSTEELQAIVVRLGDAGARPDVREKDLALALTAGQAYGVTSPREEENLDGFARRVVRHRDPHHLKVKDGQWLTALMRQLYADIETRGTALARFERDRHLRRWLEQRSTEAGAAKAVLARELEVQVEGLEGTVALPPRVGGDAPSYRGAKAEVTGDKLIVERLPRATLVGGRIAPETPRTQRGSVRELYSALKQFDTTASMLGRYDSDWAKKRGHVQAILPAAGQASVLNELVRAALEAKMKVVHLITLDRDGQPREIALQLRMPKSKRRRVALASVDCRDDMDMDTCAKRIAHAHSSGPVHFTLP